MINKCCCNNISCECLCNNQNNIDMCKCGFDDDKNIQVFPENYMYGQSYVPIQFMSKTFIPNVGLKMGTIFPELVSSYEPCQSIREIEYLKSTNNIGKECNL